MTTPIHRAAAPAGRTVPTPGTDTAEFVDRMMSRRPAVGFALAVVRADQGPELVTRGVADVTSRRPVGPDTAFRIASITKTLTAVAVMTLLEDGLIGLDDPVDAHLRAFRLTGPGGERAVTVRHLLTHTSGLPEVLSLPHALRPDFGESVPPGARFPSLAEYYGGTLRAVAEPGRVFCYTNHGPATLGQLVEDVTGRSLQGYLRERVLGPWGMDSTDLGHTGRPTEGRATGYRLTARGPRAVEPRHMVTAGAAAAWSTPADMTRYATALLGGGTNEHGSVLPPRSLETMFAPHYRPHPGLPGMGLGFFRGERGGHPTVEHQGIIPGFDSNLVLAPDDGVGVVAMATGTRLAMFWLPDATGRLLGRLVGAPADRVREDLPQRPEVWPRVCGWYQVPTSFSDLRLRSIVGAGVQVLVRRGRLTLRCLNPAPALWRGVELHPDDPADPLMFRFDLAAAGLGPSRVAFRTDSRTGLMAMHLEVMPLTAHRRR